MFRYLKQKYYRKHLKDEEYAFLFEKSDPKHYVSFDVETTGLDPKKDEIISIGAVKIEENRILASQKFERFVALEGSMREESVKIHKIRKKDLENAEDIQTVLRSFLHFIGNATLVGYYLEFDVAMINKYLKPFLGIRLPNEMIDVSGRYYDYKIGRIPQGHVDLRFDSMMQELGLPPMGKHDALSDAIMTAMIFIKLNHLKG